MFYFCEAFLTDPPPVPEEKIRTEIHPQHVQFVADGVEKGIVIFGGPKPSDGGAILIKAPSRKACQAFLDGDPMLIAGAQQYRITEFQIFEHNPCLDPILTEE